MTRVNIREVIDRFNHIDGRIISTEVLAWYENDTFSTRVVLRFYAWWEHPAYIAARNAGRDWGFDVGAEADRDMAIIAVNTLRCDVRFGASAIDLAFLTDDPVLWDFEDEAQIYVNSDFEPRELIEGLLRSNAPQLKADTLLKYIYPYARFRAPYALGYFPLTLFHLVKNELERMGVAVSAPKEPVAKPRPVALAIDDNVLIVAEDFLVEVPDFEHHPEWFRPRSGG